MTSVFRPCLVLLTVALLSVVARPNDGADITVVRIAGDSSDYVYFGQSGGIAAYAMGTTACNNGTVPIDWAPFGAHPVIGQNLFRLRDGLFEHIGQAWLKHGYCAVNETLCGTCQPSPCDNLGIGCADTYTAAINDGTAGGPKYLVEPATGVHTHPHPQPTGPATIRGRLQVAVADIDPTVPENQGAQWFAEAQYVSAHDHGDGNAANNSAWQRVHVVAVETLLSGGATVTSEPAILAWRAIDPLVHVEQLVSIDEGGPGVHGYFWVASRAYQLETGWRYVYAVQNFNSGLAGASVSLPVPDELFVSGFYFRDVPYHSGEPYDGTDWTAAHVSGRVTFTCTQTWQQNPNANALRWGTLYSFAFECDSPPQLATGGELGLFAPGGAGVLGFQAQMPGGEPPVGSAFCSGDGSGAFCPCFNFGDPGNGCGNGSFGGGARLEGQGAASISADSVTLRAARATPSQPALFFQGDVAVGGGAGMAFGDGLRCAGQHVVRLETVTTSPNGDAASTVGISARAGLSPGDIKRYQLWYRDPAASPCGHGFNLTNGLELAWTP